MATSNDLESTRPLAQFAPTFLGDHHFSVHVDDYRSGSGTILRIKLENFMCHSNLQIEFGEWVNFITGQNGSGKSAILTALCVAFGCRAKGTQRASTLKDFIKTGCSYAVVHVEIKNQGEDAFKPEVYGDVIIVERRITESASSTILKDHEGKKVSSRKDELRELVEHYNIDVENPCVVMSQDKSREFLHSGNDKDKFKDAVSRKISLDALVDFAIAHGAQWMFITPHDISMVKSHERIKKQQMAAPRS
ncbi:hypothetical protein F2Q70_00032515 [Brassica cretica]|uniref:Rad50/SbcC-type AAA domain-containing protein n=1 Tax=Brassica cretica TaxID=69181 RepID=A0A8S9FI62_BRACR|nr:hypothetical protein F2Q70_00032515 [Brassica cretica]